MKAHINGITIEGTPQEIAEYQKLLPNMNCPYPQPWENGWFGIFPPYEANKTTPVPWTYFTHQTTNDMPEWMKETL